MTSCSLVIPNQVEQVATATGAFRAFASENSLQPDDIYDGELAIEEVVSNIIFYAYPVGGVHQIQVAFEIHNQELTISIRDDGEPFNPLDVPPPDLTTSLEDRKIGGLGIHLVRTAMDEIAYERKNNQNCLLMKKKLE